MIIRCSCDVMLWPGDCICEGHTDDNPLLDAAQSLLYPVFDFCVPTRKRHLTSLLHNNYHRVPFGNYMISLQRNMHACFDTYTYGTVTSNLQQAMILVSYSHMHTFVYNYVHLYVVLLQQVILNYCLWNNIVCCNYSNIHIGSFTTD